MKLPSTTRLEWEVKDESNAIGTTRLSQGDPIYHYAPKRSLRHWRLIVFASTLLLLATFIGVARMVTQAKRNIVQTEREIELAVEADSWLHDPSAPKPH